MDDARAAEHAREVREQAALKAAFEREQAVRKALRDDENAAKAAEVEAGQARFDKVMAVASDVLLKFITVVAFGLIGGKYEPLDPKRSLKKL